jgi:hypothetical protein
MPAPDWIVELPEEWQTAPWRPGFMRVLAEVTLPRKRQALLVMGLLKDGTNIIALTWDRGQRLARLNPGIDAGLDERFSGRPPGPGEGVLIRAWRVGIQALVHAGKAAAADIAAGDIPAVAFVLADDDALEHAYEAYCASDGPTLSREEFEILVEHLAAEQLEGGASS